MNRWYVKDLSKLTGVSVQTLHHYDRISLLKPSIRLSNGYRVYSEKDLLKLQQIIALKFFGFELTQIKMLLASESKTLERFSTQAQFLEEKAKNLLEASKALKSIIAEVKDNKSIPWETIIKLIEVYRMTQQLEKTWVGKVLTPNELKQYADFETGLKTRFTPEEKKNFEQKWASLVSQMKANLHQDPKSELGLRIAKETMDMINGLYGKEHSNLRRSIWEKGFKKGRMDEEHLMTKEAVAWLDKAIDNYYRSRIYQLLDKVTSTPSSHLSKAWDDLMEEMCGNEETLKKDIVQAAQTDKQVSVIARQWLLNKK